MTSVKTDNITMLGKQSLTEISDSGGDVSAVQFNLYSVYQTLDSTDSRRQEKRTGSFKNAHVINRQELNK